MHHDIKKTEGEEQLFFLGYLICQGQFAANTYIDPSSLVLNLVILSFQPSLVWL